MKKAYVLILIVLPVLFAKATVVQLTGPANVTVGQTTTYSYVSSGGIIVPGWTVSPGRGTILNPRKSGTTYYADVQWTQAGVATITLSNDGEVNLASLNITIISTSPELLSGSATVNEGETATYSFAPSNGISTPIWVMSENLGTILNPRKIGTTYYVDVQWTQAGITTVALSDNGQTDIATINVSVAAAPLPPVPLNGPAIVTKGDVITYSYTSSIDLISPYWAISPNRGTVVNQRKVNIQAGTTYYYADIEWTQTGTANVALSTNEGSSQIAYLSVTINSAPIPPVLLTGSSTVNEGEISTYTYVSTGIIIPDWTISSAIGTILNTWKTGTTYYADIQWVQDGVAIITLSNDGEVELANLNITIKSTTPETTFLITEQCGNTSITRNSSPVSGREWFWQTSPSGTSTSLGSGPTVLQATSGEQYYLRTRMTISGAWTGALPVGNVTVYNMPSSPVIANHGAGFKDAAVTLSVIPVSGVTAYRWYAINVGGRVIEGANTNSYTVNALTSTLTFYVASILGPCENSIRIPVMATLVPDPQINAIVNQSLTMANPVILGTNVSYATYSWKNSLGEIMGTQHELLVVQPGEYFLTVTKAGVSGSGTSKFKVDRGPSGQNLNYILSNTILQDNVTDVTSIANLPVESNNQNIQYIDGLGRIIQILNTQGSPAKKDIVQPIVYDAYGKEEKKYLPFTAQSDGWFKADIIDPVSDNYVGIAQPFYAIGSVNEIADDTHPYSESIFENSSLNRPVRSYAAGSEWAPSGINNLNGKDKYAEFQYLVNVHGTGALAEKVSAFKVNGSGMLDMERPISGIIEDGGYYSTGQLMIKVSIDEHRNIVREYANKKSQIILKKVQVAVSTSDLNNQNDWASTYYLYDDFGNLVVVLPPEAVKALTAH